MGGLSRIDSIAVLGGGLMGSGIAESAAAAGIDVVIRDLDDGALDRARGRLDTSLDRALQRGKRTGAEVKEILDRISLTTDLAEISSAELVIEAVPEDESLKRAVLAEVEEAVPSSTIIASNTSSIPIAQLAQAISAPQRLIGMHFFSPVPVMPLVEIVVGIDTDPSTTESVRSLAERLGKTAIVSGDRAGFIVNALLIPYLMSAVRMLEHGFATCEDIDAGMQLGCGHPMGPLTLADFIGLDVLLGTGESLYAEFRREEYAPPPLLKRMVAAGRLGRKSGRGFYDY